MLADAVQRMEEFPERVMLPGIAISLTVLSVNYLGDGCATRWIRAFAAAKLHAKQKKPRLGGAFLCRAKDILA